jgi:hypothetical protein
MHVQIVTFSLKDISDANYRGVCDQLADVVARTPGLVSKVWLADEVANTYGGVYTWVDRPAMEAYLRSDLFAGVAANPNFANVTSSDFEVLEGPSSITRAPITVAA